MTVGKAHSFPHHPKLHPRSDSVLLQDTVLTCFPGEFTASGSLEATRENPSDISASILNYVSDSAKRRWNRNAE